MACMASCHARWGLRSHLADSFLRMLDMVLSSQDEDDDALVSASQSAMLLAAFQGGPPKQATLGGHPAEQQSECSGPAAASGAPAAEQAGRQRYATSLAQRQSHARTRQRKKTQVTALPQAPEGAPLIVCKRPP